MSNPQPNKDTSTFVESTVRSPAEVRDRVKHLNWQKKQLAKTQKLGRSSLEKVEQFLALADDVSSALESLSSKLFQQLIGTLEDKLTVALRDILDQPIRFKAIPKTLRNATALDFAIERDGNIEDARRAQGGSVQNILSVGLRLFALASLSEEHRGLLVLDEQDCWLRPELVPRLVNIVHAAAEQLGFQVLMISHHDTSYFHDYADKIYALRSEQSVAKVKEYQFKPMKN